MNKIDEQIKELFDKLMGDYLQQYKQNPDGISRIRIESLFDRFKAFNYDCSNWKQQYESLNVIK